jgi:hypothetical protein
LVPLAGGVRAIARSPAAPLVAQLAVGVIEVLVVPGMSEPAKHREVVVTDWVSTVLVQALMVPEAATLPTPTRITLPVLVVENEVEAREVSVVLVVLVATGNEEPLSRVVEAPANSK